MTPEEYAALQANLTAAAASYSLKFATFIVEPLVNTAEWLAFLQLMFPTVERYRQESAALAREFYDTERLRHNPELPRHDVFLETYDFQTFVKNMEPTRKMLSQPRAPKAAVANTVMHVAREVENAGRQQIVKAVEDDYRLLTQKPVVPEPEPVRYKAPASRIRIEATWEGRRSFEAPAEDPVVEQLKRDIAESAGKVEKPKNLQVKATGPVRGWARVATGRETCAFCLVMISRGPVYQSAKGAGLDLYDAGAAAALNEGQDVSEWMNEWHIGCDCKVVPVYDKFDWPGRYAAERALELWNDASREAAQVLEQNPGKKYFSKKQNRWLPTTENREAINALRRRLDRGEITTSEFAALAA